MEAQGELARNGWNAEIIYVHTIWPLDTAMIRKSLEKTKRVLVVEEHNRLGGIGTDILQITGDVKELQFFHICIDSFIHDYGSYEDLCAKAGFSVSGIKDAIQGNFVK
jgi:transketolase